MENAQQEKNWYVVVTYPNLERKALLNLLKNNFIAFLPLQKVQRKWSDRKKTIEIPLFPNYLFININEKDRFEALDIYGVKRYVTFGGRPAFISETDILNIKRIVESVDLYIEHSLVKGDAVKIIGGPFKDMIGILFKKSGQARFGIRVESMNQTLSIEICHTLIRKVF
ncbi:UpxY family transcription antiterminator [Pedobacter heparinus]|uniref:NGN domain protein n=1 Tax=Pedobacter heparinus (strain ATCC 13125 / DSM 2366 / CIP 104194 / JCM 7457 / NBRC 12017 / NCIMB 9290 / NRRL B-14731 / HIM 762-3) TaxID=485917 RepID=C6Y0K9_PEDHD|nr:UpxY family transcription antiterminator [Pedobacter heparinus]ACU02770.1 NGN domain protein [Pedobacter heparinus DSM 2366]